MKRGVIEMERLKNAIQIVKRERFSNLPIKDNPEEILNYDQEQVLVRLIVSMSTFDQNLLFYKYSYKLSCDDIEEILEIDNVEGRLDFMRNYLSEILGLENKIIAEKSLMSACKEAMEIVDSEVKEDFCLSKNKGFSFPKSRRLFLLAIASIFLLIGLNRLTDGNLSDLQFENKEKDSWYYAKETGISEYPWQVDGFPYEFEFLTENLDSSEQNIYAYETDDGSLLIIMERVKP